MARQKGHIKYVGTIGDVRHFKIKGSKGYFAGLTGGPTAEQIATAPEFARTRENMNEFGGCALVGKSFRNSISGLIKAIGDSRVAGRLTGIMKKINLEDGSEARGKRAILISQASQYLKGFEFNKYTPFDSVVRFQYETVVSEDRKSIEVKADGMLPIDNLKAPSGATHFSLVNALSVMSDFEYNTDTGTYQPKEDGLNEIAVISKMTESKIDEAIPPLILPLALPEDITLTPDVSVVHVIAVEFYQEVNGNFYLLSQGNAMKVNQIF